MRAHSFLLPIFVILAVATGCTQNAPPKSPESRLTVVATLFPLYDAARAISGNRADVRLLLPPGVEPHNFEPRPDDMIAISRSGLFIYTNRFMEPWVDKLLQGVVSARTTVVDASAGLTLLPPAPGLSDRHGHRNSGGAHRSDSGGMDPHVWLDLENAVKMVDAVLAGFIAADPANRTYYEANSSVYRTRIENLHRRYTATLAGCGSTALLHAGHYAFGYLARRYGLDYYAATGITADAEPTPARLAELVKQVRTLNIKVIYTEELVSPKIAETLASETGVAIAKLHAGHNISREELSRGITFPDLMEQNLAVLAKGLQCRQ